MPFDLNILCFNQNHITTQLPENQFVFEEVFHKRKDDLRKGYHTHWQFMNHSPGFWYSLLPREGLFDDPTGCYEMCDICYPERAPELKLGDEILTGAEWREYRKTLPYLEIKKEFRADFEKVVDFFLDESPSKTILFLARYQGQEEDVVDGVYPHSIFFEMLDDFYIQFNVCYIIRKESLEYQKRFVHDFD